MQHANYSNEELGVSVHDCVVCGDAVSEKRRDDGEYTCSEKCRQEWRRVLNEVLQEGVDDGFFKGEELQRVLEIIEED